MNLSIFKNFKRRRKDYYDIELHYIAHMTIYLFVFNYLKTPLLFLKQVVF